MKRAVPYYISLTLILNISFINILISPVNGDPAENAPKDLLTKSEITESGSTKGKENSLHEQLYEKLDNDQCGDGNGDGDSDDDECEECREEYKSCLDTLGVSTAIGLAAVGIGCAISFGIGCAVGVIGADLAATYGFTSCFNTYRDCLEQNNCLN